MPPSSGVARSKARLPTTSNPGGVSTLTMTVRNANATDTLLPSALTDTVLGGVVIALGDGRQDAPNDQ